MSFDKFYVGLLEFQVFKNAVVTLMAKSKTVIGKGHLYYRGPVRVM